MSFFGISKPWVEDLTLTFTGRGGRTLLPGTRFLVCEMGWYQSWPDGATVRKLDDHIWKSLSPAQNKWTTHLSCYHFSCVLIMFFPFPQIHSSSTLNFKGSFLFHLLPRNSWSLSPFPDARRGPQLHKPCRLCTQSISTHGISPFPPPPSNQSCPVLLLEKTLESPLDCKEIQPVRPKGNQPWIFIGRTNAETPILWPPDAKSQLTGKNPDAGKDWRQEEKGR